jgi:hypothetical protein
MKMHRIRIAHGALAVILATLAACFDDGPTGPGPSDDELPFLMPVVGHGAVSDRFTAEVAVHGGWAYTTTWGNRNGTPGNVLNIWSLAQPQPQLSASITVEGATTLGDVQVSDDGSLLIVATEHRPNGSLLVFDRSDPGAPDLLARYATERTQNGVHTAKLGRVAGGLFAFLAVNPGPNNVQEPSRLVILDLAEPASPVEVFAQPMGNPFIHDVFVRDGWLFAALWNEGLVIFDIGAESGSPASPREVGRVVTQGGNVHNVWWFHDPRDGSRLYAFVGEERFDGFIIGNASAGDVHVVDVSDMANPHEVAFFSVDGAGAHNFVMDEVSGVLYAAFYNGGVRALDVRGDLSACSAAERAADGRCDLRLMGRELAAALVSPAGGALADRRSIWGVALRGSSLYASDMLHGLWHLDISELLR